MYIRTLDGLELGWGPILPTKWPQSALRKQFISKVVTYKDANGAFQATKSSIYVPAAWRNPFEMDVLVFFHGLLRVCDIEHNDPDRLIKNFRLDVQVDSDPQLALVAPIVRWNHADRSNGIIQAAWSAANLNAFVEEVLDQIGNSYGTRPKLRRLILVGHSAAYEILAALASQFEAGVADTKDRNGALAKLKSIVAMDTTYGPGTANALERWARKLGTDVVLNVVQSKSDSSVAVWQKWIEARNKNTSEALPTNLRVFPNVTDKHCDLPANFLTTYNYSSP